MVNYQASQYVLLNLIFYMSCLGIFQYVRIILQYSLPLDHPVVPLIPKKLDGEGPVDNRPSTDKLHHFVKKTKKCDM